MTSHRPYLLRALYEWIADNGLTPHLLVEATQPGVMVPAHAVSDGRIVLNVAERAVSGLDMGNDLIRFSARFGGVSHSVSVPVGAVLAIYARENGQGMALPPDAFEADVDGESLSAEAPLGQRERQGQPALELVQDSEAGPDDDGPDGDAPPRPPRGSHLRIVK